MKAILMAAGIGSRISRIIEKPKSTMDIRNTTIIGHTVSMLIKNNIEVIVVVGYRSHEIKKALADYQVTYAYNPFFRVTNSIGSLWFAKDFMNDDDIILTNADVFWEQEMLDIVLKDEHDRLMLADKKRKVEGDYFFNVDSAGKLIEFGKDLDIENRNCEYVGVAKLKMQTVKFFKEQLCALIEHEEYNLWWENVLYFNNTNYPVFVKDVGNLFWSEVDYIEDYEKILNYVNSEQSNKDTTKNAPDK